MSSFQAETEKGLPKRVGVAVALLACFVLAMYVLGGGSPKRPADAAVNYPYHVWCAAPGIGGGPVNHGPWVQNNFRDSTRAIQRIRTCLANYEIVQAYHT